MAEPTGIPGPKGLPFLGNILDLQDEVPIRAMERLADVYGPIFKINTLGRELILVSGFDIFDELCDETRFYKLLGGKLAEAADQDPEKPRGLFTQPTEKAEDWGQAHRILMPAFGPLAVANMFNGAPLLLDLLKMHDIGSQLVLKWARQGPQCRIQASEDFSRLTLDTIALCAMDYRFNSFYQEDMHPFVKAMNNSLGAANNAGQLASLVSRLLPSHKEQLKRDDELMERTSREIVQYRRGHPTEKKDLLNALIYGKDPKTNQTMRDALIAANMVTFLIAGHETTSGLLSFAFLQLLQNPEAYSSAQEEVDRVVGHARIEVKHVSELKYINAVLRETLRLTPTAPGFSRAVRPENTEKTVYVGSKNPESTKKYAIPREQAIICLLSKIQRDPKVWGDDAEDFKPERMLDGKFEKLPKNAWKPFGTGMRACIGRAFAWQEAVLAIALILQNFDMQLDDPNYEMKVVQSLTIKPKDFYMRASLRDGITPVMLLQRLGGDQAKPNGEEGSNGIAKGLSVAVDSECELSILYGSNTGTCQALAQRLAAQCAQRGLKPQVQTLDSIMGKIPNQVPMVVITASYEGLPTDDAARFVAWLKRLNDKQSGKEFEGVKYAVFGCGHSGWVSTYQQIPKLLDKLLTKFAADRIAERGSSDVSKQDPFGDFDTWTSGKLWPALESRLQPSQSPVVDDPTIPTLELEFVRQERAVHLQQSVQWANVVNTKVLTALGEPEKRHIEIELPSNVTYRAGDYLTVLPLNPKEYVKRVMAHFDLPWDSIVTIKKGSAVSLPAGEPITIFDLLQGYVEISQPITRQDIEVLTSICTDDGVRKKLGIYLEPTIFTSEIIAKRITILDLLMQHASAIPLRFSTYLSMLPPMRTRNYSISSSPLASPHAVSLTYSVVDVPAWYQPNMKEPAENELQLQRFLGVTSSYLRSLTTGDKVLVSVRSANKHFHLPADPEKEPIVMLANGSGVAPFRGFVQERATLLHHEGRKELAPAVLFVGCRRAGKDQLYADEFDEWAKMGAVDVRWVFSREPNAKDGCRYVQDRFFKDNEDISKLWKDGAKFYICGSMDLAQGIGMVAKKMFLEAAKKEHREVTDEQIDDFVTGLRNERFVMDIF